MPWQKLWLMRKPPQMNYGGLRNGNSSDKNFKRKFPWVYWMTSTLITFMVTTHSQSKSFVRTATATNFQLMKSSKKCWEVWMKAKSFCSPGFFWMTLIQGQSKYDQILNQNVVDFTVNEWKKVTIALRFSGDSKCCLACHLHILSTQWFSYN